MSVDHVRLIVENFCGESLPCFKWYFKIKKVMGWTTREHWASTTSVSFTKQNEHNIEESNESWVINKQKLLEFAIIS